MCTIYMQQYNVELVYHIMWHLSLGDTDMFSWSIDRLSIYTCYRPTCYFVDYVNYACYFLLIKQWLSDTSSQTRWSLGRQQVGNTNTNNNHTVQTIIQIELRVGRYKLYKWQLLFPRILYMAHPADLAGPNGSFDPVVTRNSEVLRGFKSRPGRIFVSKVVHIQYSKLFKGLECIVLSMVGLLCTIKNPWSYLIIFRASFCRVISMIVQNVA